MSQIADAGNTLTEACHVAASSAGWWDNYFKMPAEYHNYYIATMLGLVHSEVSEAMEGLRKGKQDDHLPEHDALEVELADAVIRIFDIAGALGYIAFGDTIASKMAYNAERADHKPEHRAQPGGKAF